MADQAFEIIEDSYKITANESVVIVTFADRSLTTFSDALTRVRDTHHEKEILMMQSVEKENEPFKVVIVFKFF